MLPDIERTIVALASGPRPAARAIVRMTGGQTRAIIQQLCQGPNPSEPRGQPLRSNQRWTGQAQCWLPRLDRWWPVTILFWPDHRSYTGAPSAELHMLGCLPLAEAVIDRCCQLGAQPAQRGEFTLRAFLAGKLDLAQAEAILGVIEAQSMDQLRTALAQLGGNLAPAIAPLRDRIVHIVAELEAGLDFVEEDIQFIDRRQIVEQLEQLQAQLDDFANRLDTRSVTDALPKVVLTGLPNSGKSSLFNALCNQPLAIVADVAGTTRDYLQHKIVLDQHPAELIDTAGWERIEGDTPRAMAQQKLSACLAQADLIAMCVDLSERGQATATISSLRAILPIDRNAEWIVIGTKSDIGVEGHAEELVTICEGLRVDASSVVITSVHDSHSIARLRGALQDALTRWNRRHERSDPLAVVHQTAVRCRAALASARNGMATALQLALANDGEELIAAELRLVLDELATIIGQVHSDDILGEIFSRFCIGK